MTEKKGLGQVMPHWHILKFESIRYLC